MPETDAARLPRDSYSYSQLTPDDIAAMVARGNAERGRVVATFFARMAQRLRRPQGGRAAGAPRLRPSH